MLDEARKFLWDARAAATAIGDTKGRRWEDYAQDHQLRSAVERQLEIIGEALAQAARVDETVAEFIPDLPRIVALRNILIHGYAIVDDRLVWSVIHENIPDLRAVLDDVLE